MGKEDCEPAIAAGHNAAAIGRPAGTYPSGPGVQAQSATLSTGISEAFLTAQDNEEHCIQSAPGHQCANTPGGSARSRLDTIRWT